MYSSDPCKSCLGPSTISGNDYHHIFQAVVARWSFKALQGWACDSTEKRNDFFKREMVTGNKSQAPQKLEAEIKAELHSLMDHVWQVIWMN